jgi:hypothetical protein
METILRFGLSPKRLRVQFRFAVILSPIRYTRPSPVSYYKDTGTKSLAASPGNTVICDSSAIQSCKRCARSNCTRSNKHAGFDVRKIKMRLVMGVLKGGTVGRF